MLTLEEAREMQTALNRLGHAAGEVDGIIGRGTRRSVQRFQIAQGLLADGFPTRAVYRAIMEAARR